MKKHYLIDESGDPDFYSKRGKELWLNEGWNRVLMIGLIEVDNRSELRKDIEAFHRSLRADPLFEGIYSFSQKDHYFHARKDHPCVISAFFQFLESRDDFKFYMVIGRKQPERFVGQFDKSSTKFYFHLVRLLIELPRFDKGAKHLFYLSRRNNTTNERFDDVLKLALKLEMNEEDLDYKADLIKSAEYPEMSVVDYLLWAMQRYIVQGESRFFEAVKSRIVYIYDAFDEIGENNLYGPNGNDFSLEKAGKFK